MREPQRFRSFYTRNCNFHCKYSTVICNLCFSGMHQTVRVPRDGTSRAHANSSSALLS